jgi:hypothetical protein
LVLFSKQWAHYSWDSIDNDLTMLDATALPEKKSFVTFTMPM